MVYALQEISEGVRKSVCNLGVWNLYLFYVNSVFFFSDVANVYSQPFEKWFIFCIVELWFSTWFSLLSVQLKCFRMLGHCPFLTDVSPAVQNPSWRSRRRVPSSATTRESFRTRKGSARSSTRTATPPRSCTTRSVSAGTTPPSMNVSSESCDSFPAKLSTLVILTW